MRRLLVLLAACGASKQAPTCDQVADRAKSLFHLLGDPADYDPDPRLVAHDAVLARCQTDRWPDAVRACMFAAATAEDLPACGAKLSPEQSRALAADLDEAARKLTVTVPKARATQVDAEAHRSLVIHVHADATVDVAGRAIVASELELMLRAVAAGDRETQIVFKADPKTSHGEIIKLMELAKQAGLTRLAIATGP